MVAKDEAIEKMYCDIRKMFYYKYFILKGTSGKRVAIKILPTDPVPSRALCDNLATLRFNQHCMFKMTRKGAICCAKRPSIIVLEKGI